MVVKTTISITESCMSFKDDATFFSSLYPRKISTTSCRVGQMLEPYRTLGLVNGSTSKPCLQRRGTEYFITCAVDSVLQLYNVSKLHLKGCSPILVRDSTESVIRSIVCYKDWTFAASFDTILVFHRLQLKEYWKEHTKDISHLLIFGGVLLSVSSTEQRVIVWDLSSHERLSEFYLPINFQVTCIEHPET